MVSASLSLLHSTAFSDSSSSSSSIPTRRTGSNPNPSLRYSNILKLAPLKVKAVASSSASSPSPLEDGSADQFSQSSSIADFMRFKRGAVDGSNGELQTAVVSYRKKFPWSILQPFLQVDLVSTIHIADKEYFKTLQEELESYDCVLYEMVASRESLENRRNSAVTKKLRSSRSRGFNILGCIQRQMARILTLDFQLHCLDYEAENWYHADLDFETFNLLQVTF